MESLYRKISHQLLAWARYYNQIPSTMYRRHANIMYGKVEVHPFEYALAKGLVTGMIIMGLGLMFVLSGAMGPVKGIGIMVIALPMGVFLEGEEIKKKVSKREKAITVIFSRISANCMLYLTSGLSVRRAFIQSVIHIEDELVKDALQGAVRDLETNAKTSEVFANMNDWLKHAYVSEFTSILEQVEKYGSGAKSDLDRLIKSSWQLRRDIATQSAKEMETKLVFPSMLIFLGVMLMVAVGLILQMK